MAQKRNSTRDDQNSKISSLTQENDALLQSEEVDQAKKDQARAVVNFAQQVINAEEFTGRDLRLYNLGISQAVNKILKGEQAYSESMTGDAKTNIFGYYSRHGQPSELDWMVNETVKRSLSGRAAQGSSNTPTSTTSTPMRQIVNFTPASGFNSYVLPTTTIGDKVNNFAKHLANKLQEYINNPYDESKYIISGLNANQADQFASYVNTLNSIGNRQGTAQDILTIGNIVSALGNEDLTSSFESYFQNELAGNDQSSATSQPVPGQAAQTVQVGNATLQLAQHPDAKLNQYFADNGYTLYKDATGNYYVQGLTADKAETNPRSEFYKYGFFVDPINGTELGKLVSYGNLADSNYLQTVKDRWAVLAPKVRAEYNQKFAPVDYTSQGGERGIDFSHYLPGSDVVFVGGDKYKAWEEGSDVWLPFDQWIENWEEARKGFDWGGNADVSVSGADMKNQYADSLGVITDPKLVNILNQTQDLSDDDIQSIFGGSGDKSGDINNSGVFSDYTVSDILQTDDPIASKWDLKTRLAAFVGYALLGEYDRLNKVFVENTQTGDNNESIGDMFMRQLQSDTELYKRVLKMLSKTRIGGAEKTKLLRQKVSEELQKIEKKQSGGVLKHISGTFQGGVQKPTGNSTSDAKMSDWSNLSRKQKAVIGMTAASILNDLASIGTAHIPVAGPWISGAQAIAGMGVDLATDIMSGQSAKQTAINAGISGATGAAGMLVGSAKLAKAGLWAKRIGNIAKYALGAISFADVASKFADKKIRDSWTKLEHPSEMTIQDWINVGHSLRSIANASVNVSARNRISTDKGTTTVNPTKKLVVSRNKNTGDKTYKEVSTEALENATKTDGKWWQIGKNAEQRRKQANELVGEDNELVFGFRGKPRTRDVVEFDATKQAVRQAQSDRFVPQALQEKIGYENYKPGPQAGEKASEWDLSLDIKLPGQTIKPVTMNKAKWNGNEIKVYGITKQDMESGKVSQIAPNLVRQSTKGWPKSVLDALPKDTKEVWFSRKNNTIVYVSEPKTNKNGGKLDNLRNYINNK